MSVIMSFALQPQNTGGMFLSYSRSIGNWKRFNGVKKSRSWWCVE